MCVLITTISTEISIPRVSASQFTWNRWRSGSLTELGIRHRFYSILENKNIIKSLAIGYCPAELLWVRPKENCIAVMFFVNNSYFWTHLTTREFITIFSQERKMK